MSLISVEDGAVAPFFRHQEHDGAGHIARPNDRIGNPGHAFQPSTDEAIRPIRYRQNSSVFSMSDSKLAEIRRSTVFPSLEFLRRR